MYIIFLWFRFQAAAYGLPVVATKNGGPVDILKVSTLFIPHLVTRLFPQIEVEHTCISGCHHYRRGGISSIALCLMN